MHHGASDTERCELCERDVPRALITQHHLTPKERGGKAGAKAPLCKPSHKQLHAVFSNKDLAGDYASLESLRSAASLQPFLKWIRKQKGGRNFRTIMSTSHPKSKRRR